MNIYRVKIDNRDKTTKTVHVAAESMSEVVYIMNSYTKPGEEVKGIKRYAKGAVLITK